MKYTEYVQRALSLTDLLRNVPKGRGAISKAVWKPLPLAARIDCYTFPKGAEYKAWESPDFGWVVFKEPAVPGGKRIFRY